MSSSLDMLGKGKYNESLKTSKRDRFKQNNRENIYSNEKGESLKFKEVSKEELEEIKAKIHLELAKNKRTQIKTLLVSTLITMVVLYSILG